VGSSKQWVIMLDLLRQGRIFNPIYIYFKLLSTLYIRVFTSGHEAVRGQNPSFS